MTGVELVAHYADATPLTINSGGWLPPDDVHSGLTTAGDVDGDVDMITVPARPGNVQGFNVDVINESAVTQTILGLATE